MTGPDRPAPQPLPAPGPPPHPSAGSGPTHPPGHPGTGSPPPPPPPKNQLPTLGMVIRDVERTLTQAITTLGRQYDPTSGPSQEHDPWGPEAVDIHLGSAVADIRSALRELDAVTLLGLPPVGSAVQYPARRTSACLSGGSASHPVRRPGEGLLPGLAAGVGSASAQSDAAYGGPPAGANHLAAAAASGGLLPGLVDATPTAADIDESVAPDAGESSDPRPGLAEGARPAHDAADPPGVGFTLPVTFSVRGFVRPTVPDAVERARCPFCCQSNDGRRIAALDGSYVRHLTGAGMVCSGSGALLAALRPLPKVSR